LFYLLADANVRDISWIIKWLFSGFGRPCRFIGYLLYVANTDCFALKSQPIRLLSGGCPIVFDPTGGRKRKSAGFFGWRAGLLSGQSLCPG